jgi:putative restriction endonuclease
MSEGARLWAEVEARLEHYNIVAKSFVTDSAAKERYGREHLVQPRLGQGAFRVLVTEAYSRKCAITGEKTLPVLDASHIKPYSKGGPHAVSNGLSNVPSFLISCSP